MNTPNRNITQRDTNRTAWLTTAAGEGKATGGSRGILRQDGVPKCGGAKAQPAVESVMHSQAPRENSCLIGEARTGKIAIHLLEEDYPTRATLQCFCDAVERGVSLGIPSGMDIVGANTHMFHVKQGPT
jgi:hypothetical protein